MEILDDPWYNKLQEDKRDLETRLAAAEARAERLAGVLGRLCDAMDGYDGAENAAEWDELELAYQQARAALADNTDEGE